MKCKYCMKEVDELIWDEYCPECWDKWLEGALKVYTLDELKIISNVNRFKKDIGVGTNVSTRCNDGNKAKEV